MNFFFRRSAPALVSGVVLFATILVVVSAGAAESKDRSRDVLWEIVTNCMDLTIADYCLQCCVPRIEKSCLQTCSCENTTEMWSESNNYVAIRDRKMCGCPQGFVHGLAIPRARVSGVEDPLRPAGIWTFAWNIAGKRIPDTSDIALVVNPRKSRSQDQLHVNIVRLKKDARDRFPIPRVSHVQSLDEVWIAAKRSATYANLNDYGVLVASHPEGGFIVLIDENSPEPTYTEQTCPH